MEHSELIIDTGFFLALFSKRDQFHQTALKLRNKIDKRKWITTWPILTEVCHLLSIREGIHIIEDFSRVHISKMKTILGKYQDLPMDLADASLVILADELGHGDIVSTDIRDFKTYRWKNHKPFKPNLRP